MSSRLRFTWLALSALDGFGRGEIRPRLRGVELHQHLALLHTLTVFEAYGGDGIRKSWT